MKRNILGRRWVTVASLGVAAALGATTLATTALFTDQKSISGNAFSTGSVVLGLTPASTLFNVPVLNPGDTYTAPLAVKNNGTMDLRYNMVSQTTEDMLAGAIQMSIKSGVTTCSNAGFGTDGTAVSTNTVLGSTVIGTKIFGDFTQGQQAGDRILAAGATENLCVQVRLPLSVTNSVSSLTDTATFTFDAEQVANNP